LSRDQPLGDHFALAMSNAPAIEVHGLVKRFGDVCALDGVDLTAAHGQVLGLLGRPSTKTSPVLRT
jgi:ABC-type uncharacterized transport system ATPase subunit